MKNVLLLICVFTSAHVFSQVEEDKTKKHALAVGVGTGISIDYSYQLNKTFALTAKYSLLKHTEEDFEYEIDGETLSVDGEFDFGHADLLLSIGGSLRLVAGVGYFTSNQLDVTMSFTDEVSIGDVVFSTDEVGNIKINAEWDSFLPYLGIGFGRTVPKTGFGFGLEVGTYYDSDGPKMTLDATGLIEETKNQQELLQDSFKENKFLPYVNLRFAYSF